MNLAAADTLMGIFGFYRVTEPMTTDQTIRLMAYNAALRNGNEPEIQRTRQELIESLSDAVSEENQASNANMHDNMSNVTVQKKGE